MLPPVCGSGQLHPFPLLPPCLRPPQPLSLEELLRRKQAEKDAQAKPVFLTKEQRAQLALAKRAEEAAAARERLAAMRQGLADSGLRPSEANGGRAAAPGDRDGCGHGSCTPLGWLLRRAGSCAGPAHSSFCLHVCPAGATIAGTIAGTTDATSGGATAGTSGEEGGGRRTLAPRRCERVAAPSAGQPFRAQRRLCPGKPPCPPAHLATGLRVCQAVCAGCWPPLCALACLQERERQRELELIKQQYLGAEKQKKKVLKATERMKFVFDWDAEEDTSRDLNPLYQNLHGAGCALAWVGLGTGRGCVLLCGL